MTLVSVIIPCYNQAHYLNQAIESVMAQTFRDFEIIVVDDGSTDETAPVAARFGESVRYIYQANAGLSAARNTGIRAATGEYFGFLDSDDLWLPDFLKTLVPILDQDQRVGAVYCGSQFISAQGALLPQTITRSFPSDQLHNVLTDGEFFPPCAVLAQRRVFDQVGLFDETLRASEDWDMWLRVSAQYLFAGVSDVLALYRMHGNNMSQNLARMLASQLQVVDKHFPNADSLERRRASSGVYWWHSIAHYQRGESDLGLEYVRRALIAQPNRLRSLDMAYALVWAEQSPGRIGDGESLDLAQSAQRVLATYDKIFSNSDIPIDLRAKRRVAYGMAYFALGITAYSTRDFSRAREYLMRAAIHQPSLIANRQWALTFGKTLLGNRLLKTLLTRKQTRVVSH